MQTNDSIYLANIYFFCANNDSTSLANICASRWTSIVCVRSKIQHHHRTRKSTRNSPTYSSSNTHPILIDTSSTVTPESVEQSALFSHKPPVAGYTTMITNQSGNVTLISGKLSELFVCWVWHCVCLMLICRKSGGQR